MRSVRQILWSRVVAFVRGRDLSLAVLLTLGIGSALVASGWSLIEIAGTARWPGPIRVLLPLSLDVLAVAGTRAWLGTESDTALRRTGMSFSAGAVLLSLGWNVFHGLMLLAPGFPFPWQVLAATWAVPPLVVFAIALLHALSRPKAAVSRAVPDAVPRRSRPLGNPATPLPEPATVAGPVSENGPITDLHVVPESEPDLVERARRIDAEWRERTGRAVSQQKAAELLGCRKQKAAEVLRAARAA